MKDREGNLINVKSVANAHWLILGKSGYGKTWCCYRMLEEAAAQKRKCVIFDYSGSYTSEEQEKERFCCKDQCYVFDGTEPGITYWYEGKDLYSAFEAAIIETLSLRGYRQRSLLHEVMARLKVQGKEITFTSVIQEVEDCIKEAEDNENKKCGEKILNLIGQYNEIDIVFREKQDAIPSQKEEKLITIIQLSDYGTGKRKFLTELISELLWQSVREKSKCTDYVLYDEFQGIAFGKESALSVMLREGRKYGLGVWLATQVLSDYEPEQIDILQQVDTMLFFRPSERSSKGIAQLVDSDCWKRWMKALANLPRGQAILKGNYSINGSSRVVNTPIICVVDSKIH